MNQNDADEARKRLNKYDKLKEQRDAVQEELKAIEKISGNTRETRLTVVNIFREGYDSFDIRHAMLTDWEVRMALLPIVKTKLELIDKAIEAL